MKKIILIGGIFLLSNKLQAQTWAEWFRQNSTQKKYLLQQIAALKVYAGYLEKGYAITKDGLGTIQQLRQGEVNLHSNYFKSLLSVNPAIKKYAIVSSILILQKNILKECRQVLLQFRNSHQFTELEMTYLKQVCNKVIAACADDLNTLSILLKKDQLQFKDDERLRYIEEVHSGMEDKLFFIQSFSGNNKELAIQRGREAINITISKKINALQ